MASDQIPGQNNIGDGSYDLMLPHETQHVEARSPYQTCNGNANDLKNWFPPAGLGRAVL